MFLKEHFFHRLKPRFYVPYFMSFIASMVP